MAKRGRPRLPSLDEILIKKEVHNLNRISNSISDLKAWYLQSKLYQEVSTAKTEY